MKDDDHIADEPSESDLDGTINVTGDGVPVEFARTTPPAPEPARTAPDAPDAECAGETLCFGLDDLPPETLTPDPDDEETDVVATAAIRDAVESRAAASAPEPGPAVRVPRSPRTEGAAVLLLSLRAPADGEGQTGPDARFEIIKPLAEGVTGMLYLAEDRQLERRVALKVTLLEPHEQARFRDEARLLARLEHGHIVPLYDMGLADDGTPFYTMRYVQGQTLCSLVGALAAGDAALAERYTVRHLVRIFLQLLEAVEYAHASGVLHRNLKPEAVVLHTHDQVQLVAWGRAKAAGHGQPVLELEVESTQRKQPVSPAYVAPERAQEEPADERSEVFSLGAILYELLTLTRAFGGKSWFETFSAVIACAPTPPRERAPDREIPAAIEAVCLDALKKDPKERIGSVAAFREILSAFI